MLKPASLLGFLLLRQTSLHMRHCATSLDRLHLDGLKLRWETNDVSSVSVPCYKDRNPAFCANKQMHSRLTIKGRDFMPG